MKGILLINLGTPDSPNTKDVRIYLREFLMDARVIDLPYVTRWFLVNVIIATFRGPKSAKAYKKLWTENGSPLLYYGKIAKEKLQKELGDNYQVALGMRYGNPTIASALAELHKKQVSSIHIIPLYPQYASSSSGSSIEKVMELLKKQETFPAIKITPFFYQNTSFIQTLANNGKKHLEKETYDYIIFSYHGVPQRHIKKGDDCGACNFENCCNNISSKNQFCYRAQCFETTRLLVKEMNLAEGTYMTTFQSRLETRAKDPWIKPYSDVELIRLAKEGKKKILMFSPAFVADCLETIVEIGEEYQELFEEHGGEKVQLVESLNEDIAYIKEIVLG
jgi:protoporphyrin/coproporphyrin ferrochelatase